MTPHLFKKKVAVGFEPTTLDYDHQCTLVPTEEARRGQVVANKDDNPAELIICYLIFQLYNQWRTAQHFICNCTLYI